MLNMPEEAGGRGLSMLGAGGAGGGVRQGHERPRLRRRRPRPGRALGHRHARRSVSSSSGRCCAGSTARPGPSPSPAPAPTSAPSRPRPERDEDEWVLNGEKWFVTSEGDPGFYLVLAVADDEQALFIVEPWRPGLEITKTPAFLHDPYLDHHPEIVLTNVRVPEENRIPEGGGEGAREWFLVERLFIAARCCGAAQRSLELARDFALEREAFGAKIAEHQGVSFQLADSLTELLAARLLTYHAAHAFDTEPDRRVVHGKVAMAKLYASEAAGRIVDRALQVLGGRGYMLENPVARFYREVRVDRIWEGTSEIQRLIVSRGLLKRGVETYLR